MNDAPFVYVVLGDPTPLARGRFVNRRVWDSQKQEKLIFGLNLKNLHGNKPLFTGPLHLELNFFFPIPRSKQKKNLAGTYHFFRPDLDNLIKFAADCANGVLFKDDAIIASIKSCKLYDLDKPRTEIIIIPLKEVYERSSNTNSNNK